MTFFSETKFRRESQGHLHFDQKSDHFFWQSRTGNKNIWKWNGKDRLVKEDHLWRWSTLTREFSRGPKRSIYFWTKISENLA